MRYISYYIFHIIAVIIILLSHSVTVSSQTVNDTLSITKKVNLTQRDIDICDSSDHQFTKFKPQQLIAPGALMITGIIGAIDSHNNLNRSVNDAMTDLSNGKTCKIDDYVRFLPSISHLLLGSVGVKSKHGFKERFLISATSHAAMLVMGYGMKYMIHEKRPDMSDNHSFPSGHVAMAFTGAELLRSEYGTAYGIAGYAVATGVAFFPVNAS